MQSKLPFPEFARGSANKQATATSGLPASSIFITALFSIYLNPINKRG
jgi:hypothetical protein